MRFSILIVMPLLWQVISANAGSVRNGGDDILDEVNRYRHKVIEILNRQYEKFAPILGLTREAYEAMLNRFQTVDLRRLDDLGSIDVEGQKLPLDDALRQEFGNILTIDGVPKTAVNIADFHRIDLMIVEPQRWQHMDGEVLRKIRLVAHELFGIAGLEKTGETKFSYRIDENDLASVPFETAERPPVVPLWNGDILQSFPIALQESCTSSAVREKINALVTETCKPHVPEGSPAPYFNYECSFTGHIYEIYRAEYHVVESNVLTYIPGYQRVSSSETHEHQHFSPSSDLQDVYRSRYYFSAESREGYFKRIKERKVKPSLNKECHIGGGVHLTGIDPIIPGKTKLELLASSANTWEESLSNLEADPQTLFRNACFHKRQQIRKELVNLSRCVVFPLDDRSGNWRWELWAVHPYRSQYQFELIKAVTKK